MHSVGLQHSVVLLGKVEVVVGDVRNSDDEDTHAAASAVDDSRRNMDERAFLDRMLDAVQQDEAIAVEDVVQLGRPFVVVLLRAVDIDGVRPGGDVGVLTADEPIAPTAGAALARGFAFVADEGLE
jgi:hypothetical protein